MRVPILTLVLCAALTTPIAVHAQAPTKPPATDTDTPATKGRPDTDPCAQGRASVGSGNEVIAPNAKKDQTLSDHLAQSGGVICPPPAIDPAIKAPTPDAGRIQVIPPPGTPGGDPNVKPK
jgi:hypothetical protein